MKFGTSIHCMDGRIQESVISFLKKRFQVDHIDTITEAGPCKIISDDKDTEIVKSIHDRILISINKHGSKTIAVSGHYDCAGNPESREVQIQQLLECEEKLRSRYEDLEIIKLWINEKWEIEEV